MKMLITSPHHSAFC